MALKITQKITSTQSGQEPKQLNRNKAVSATGREFQNRTTPTIGESINPKVIGDLNPLKGRSIAPLISPDVQFEVNGFRLSEKVHGWGGMSVVFLNLHPELNALFAGLNKWLFGAASGRWRLDDNRISNSRRWNISIEGINQ